MLWSLSCLESCGRLLGTISSRKILPKITGLEIKYVFLIFPVLAAIFVPELFRKLRETAGNKFHLVSSKSESGCPSYDQKIKIKIWRSCPPLYDLILNFDVQFFGCFWLLCWSPSCLESCGRLLGTISTKFRPNPSSWDRVMTKTTEHFNE